MKYLDGREVLLGDIVKAYGADGVVVSVIDTKQFSPEHPEEQWGYLEKGVMIECNIFGLLHLDAPEEEFTLVKRKDN